jgi:hypothetical protein
MTLFFLAGMEKECFFFFSFYKLTSYPFFYLLSPLQSQSIVFLSFYLFILFSSVHIHSFMFFHFFVCLRLMSWSCPMFVVHYVRVCVCLVLVFFLRLFSSHMGAVKIGLKRMIKHFPSFSKCINIYL